MKKLLLMGLGFCALSAGAWAADKDNAAVKNEAIFTGTYYQPAQLTKRPVAKSQAQPRYPQDMAREHLDGWANLAFIINEKGLTEEVQVTAATNPLFAAAAIAAVKQWRFTPGLKDGAAVRTLMKQRLEFNVRN